MDVGLLACAVCFSGPEETRFAFLSTTVFLSFLPLSLIFGGGFWFYRQSLA
jgi:hypothetical protein